MSEPWPAPTPRDEMLARVVTRGRRLQMINRVMIGLAIGGAAAAGVLGLGLGLSGVGPFGAGGGGAGTSVSGGALTYFACPNTGALGTFSSGDRVYLTGQDDSGEWVQVRSPEAQTTRVWIRSEFVDPDDQVDLPVSGCSTEVGEFVLDDTTTTTEVVEEEEPPVEEEPAPAPTTTVAPGPTTTVPVTSTTTTAPPGTTTTTTSTSTTTTTVPAPTIGNLSVSPDRLVRRLPPPGSCGAWHDGLEIGTVSAFVSNATAVSWVARIQGQQIGSGVLSANGQSDWQGPIGPFPGIDADDGLEQVVQVTVTATGSGGSVNSVTTFTLVNCWFG
jgi:hypothetical protein